jgi:hypothetical protein
MAHTAFSPASLDLLPGESPRPALRLLERVPPRVTRVVPRTGAGKRAWFARLWQVAWRSSF